VEGSASTITSVFVAVRPDCRRVLLDGSHDGTIRATAGENATYPCLGPQPEWTDEDAYGGEPGDASYDENMNEDQGVEPACGGCEV
jgi:hypothetical protein